MNPNQNAQQVQQPVQPQPETTTPVMTNKPQDSSSHRTLIIILIAGALLIVAAAGAFLLFMQQQNTPTTSSYTNQTSMPSPRQEPTTTPSVIEKQVEGIDTGNLEADLQDLNKDVQQL